MSRSEAGTVRTGVHVSGARSGCAGCGHPFTLHSNGKTACRAAGCASGVPVQCPACHGTTVSLLTRAQCEDCDGQGTVPAPCPGFTAGAQEHGVPELLAS
jgi:hypothetical protein